MAQTELHINVVDMEAEYLEFARTEILAVFEQFKEEKRIADELTKKLYNKYSKWFAFKMASPISVTVF